METKKIMIFGAGFYGKMAFEQYPPDRVTFFIDNDKDKQGTFFCGKKIISPLDALHYKDCYHILVASLYSESMLSQLKELGFTDYSSYFDTVHGFYETNELIVNPYIVNEAAQTEQQWSTKPQLDYSRQEVFHAVENLYKNQPLFNHIEIETINRCNGNCSFCPVNHNVDPREKAVMSEGMFYSIVQQLEEIQYAGRFTTFSNNEPLLDDRIIAFNKYARMHLPKARMHLFTNGTLLTIEKFIALTEILDELIIDNYQQELKLIKPCLEIQEYCENHPELLSKVTIVLRKPNEILTTRGGDAPNRKDLIEYPNDRCILPFKQLIIRPTGDVSLCCNDATGRFTLGNVAEESLLDIWYGPKFQMVRKCLYDGRENWGNCKYCDTFSMG